jgi:hypothetical protein
MRLNYVLKRHLRKEKQFEQFLGDSGLSALRAKRRLMNENLGDASGQRGKRPCAFSRERDAEFL